MKANMSNLRTMRLVLLSFALALPASWLSGCGRAHLSSNYAQSTSAWFAAQRVKSKSTPEEARRVIERLDAQEATAVSKSYRKTVSRGDDSGAGSRLLMIGGQRSGGGEAYMPPPSVPGQ